MTDVALVAPVVALGARLYSSTTNPFAAALRLRLKVSAVMHRMGAPDVISPFSDSALSHIASPDVPVPPDQDLAFEFADNVSAPASLSLCRCLHHAARAGWIEDEEILNLQAKFI